MPQDRGGCARHLGVVVANEPRAHREAIAAALRALRPGVSVALVEPAALDAEIGDAGVRVVICSALTPIVRRIVPYWAVLDADPRNGGRLGLAGREVARDVVDLDDVVALVDAAGAELRAT